jgi:hypothetical protein
MSNWSAPVIARIVAADDLKVSPFREDGTTYGTPTWVWCVNVAGNLYARPWNGKASRWYGAAMAQGAGRISAGGETYEVRFSAADESLAGAIDDAYRAKYPGKEYLPDMVGDGPRAASVRIDPVP